MRLSVAIGCIVIAGSFATLQAQQNATAPAPQAPILAAPPTTRPEPPTPRAPIVATPPATTRASFSPITTVSRTYVSTSPAFVYRIEPVGPQHVRLGGWKPRPSP